MMCGGSRLAIASLHVALAIGISACTTATPAHQSAAVESADRSTDRAQTTTPRATPTPTAAIIGELDAGGAGWAMTKAGGALWIQVDPPVDAIVRIDTRTGARKPAVPLGWKAKSGEEGLWVVCCDWLAKVDPATGDELLRIPMGGAMALAEGAVWLLNDGGLYRIDPATGTVGKPVRSMDRAACDSPKDLTVASGSAWLACKEGAVVRIEIATGASTSIPTAAGAHTFTLADGAVWVTNYEAGSVSRIDPATNKTTEIEGAGSGVGITSGAGFIWAAAQSGIAKIDAATNTIVDTVALGPGEYYELVWDDGIIWASTRTNRILKIDPSR